MRKVKSDLFRFLTEPASCVRQLFEQTHLLRDLQSIYTFYLSPQERAALQAMRPIRRTIYLAVWFFKSLLNKLSGARRVLLIVALLLMIGPDSRPHPVPAFLLMFLILVLELKDKLLADDELRAGRAVQAAMRPKECPELQGWETFFCTRSANHVGGDLIDCFSGEHGIIFTIGDVSGKGLPAALMMAQLQTAVRTLAIEDTTRSPAELVAALNRLYCRNGLRHVFISFLFLSIEPESNRVRLVNAGHLPPLVLSNEGLKETEKGGSALGLSTTSSFEELCLEPAAGDFLILYTDGISEARRSSGEFYGEERFFQLLRLADRNLSAKQLGEKIIASVNQFVGNTAQSDDLTLLIIKKRD